MTNPLRRQLLKMYIGRDYRDWPDTWRGGVVAIGNFDGIHRGHQAIIERVKQEALSRSAPAIILCFEPHPRKLFQPDAPEWRLLPFHRKARMLKKAGIEAILAQRFNRAFSQLDAQAFMKDVLREALGAQLVITGEEFVFGHQRGGSAQSLRDYAQASDAFDYEAIAPIGNAGEGKFSSSKIREHLRQGELRHVQAMLGRPYEWQAHVLHGEKRGRIIGFPTANLRPPPVLLPRFGVYAVRGAWEGKEALGIANLGVKPTFGHHAPLLEVHWFDLDEDLYGIPMSVSFIEHIRDEKPFDGIEALKAQIEQDVEQARAVLAA